MPLNGSSEVRNAKRSSPGIEGDPEESSRFGGAGTCGDFDADGFRDLVASTPHGTVDGKKWAGSVSVVYGSAAGLTADGNQLWHRSVDGMNRKPNKFDRFGDVIATGDFDADGSNDLVVGVYNEDLGALRDAGIVHLIWGSRTGLTPSGDETWHQDTPGINGAAERHDGFGTSIAQR